MMLRPGWISIALTTLLICGCSAEAGDDPGAARAVPTAEPPAATTPPSSEPSTDQVQTGAPQDFSPDTSAPDTDKLPTKNTTPTPGKPKGR